MIHSSMLSRIRQPSRAGLGLSVLTVLCLVGASSLHAQSAPKADCRFPLSSNVIDVTKPPYNAKGDGKTDETAALQKAIEDTTGRHKILYLPGGTYLVTKPLRYTNKITKDRNAYGYNWIQGQNSSKSIIRLKDDTFTDSAKPQAILWCGGFGSADWFHNYVQDITFDVGKGNPGAIGLQFYSNNTGAVRNCEIVSQDGKGEVGLDLGHRDMNGPLLVRQVRVKGFRIGIATARAVNSQTFEHIELSGQTLFGFDNHGQSISIRGLKSDNAVPVVRSYGVVSILEAKLTGRDGAKKFPAIVNYNGGRIALRDIATTGYSRALADVTTPDFVAAYRVKGADKAGSEGPKVAEYYSHPGTSPFGGPTNSLRLPIEESPEVTWEDPKTWAVVDSFGADPTGNKDSSAAIQKAIDSGASTIFFPGFYSLTKPVTIRGKASRLIGAGGWIDYFGKTKPNLIVEKGEVKVVTIEHMGVNGGIEIASDRTVFLRSLGFGKLAHKGKGSLFLEDTVTDDLRFVKGQRIWARQLNVENEGAHITNDGGELWILGYKTERGGTLLKTTAGGKSEVFGTFSYTTTTGKLAPMFVTEDAEVFAYFNEVCYTGDPFSVLVREKRKGETKEIKRGEGSVTPYVGRAKKE